MKWSKVSKTGGLEVKFMGVDLGTVMFTMEAGQDRDQVHVICYSIYYLQFTF